MTVDPALMRQAATKAHRVNELVGRLACWIIYPPAEPSAHVRAHIQAIETDARAEMRELAAIFNEGIQA